MLGITFPKNPWGKMLTLSMSIGGRGAAKDGVPEGRITRQPGEPAVEGKKGGHGPPGRGEAGRSRKGRCAGREAEPSARPGRDERGPYLLQDCSRSSHRPARREGKAEGFLGEVVRPGAAAVAKRRGVPPELLSWQGPESGRHGP